MKIKVNLIGLFALIMGSAFAQDKAPETKPPVMKPPIKLLGGINTDVEESIPLMSRDGVTLYYIRTLYEENTGGRLAGQDIWYSSKNPDGSFTAGSNKYKVKNLNDPANNAVVGFSKNGSKLFMISSKGKKGTRPAGVYSSEQTGEEWGEPTMLQVTNMEDKEGYVAFYVLPDESAMFISMEGEATNGAEDLYVSTPLSDGSWSKPMHLSDSINTPGYEQSPFYENGYLYFSSNGHGGVGDADILISRKMGEGWDDWSAPIKLDTPFNSPNFDAAFTRGIDGRGYFVSNRTGGMSDIFSMDLKDLDDMLAYLKELEDKKKRDMMAGAKDTTSRTRVVIPKSTEGRVYFDFDKFNLRPDAKKELDRVIAQIKADNKLNITVEGHADNLGSVEYNDMLSKKRAEEAKKYLLKNGVPGGKIKVVAYGERKPIDDNTTPQGRQNNRRVYVEAKASPDGKTPEKDTKSGKFK